MLEEQNASSVQKKKEVPIIPVAIIKPLRTAIFSLSIILGIVGILVSLVIVYILYSSLDAVSVSIEPQLDRITITLQELENAIADVEKEAGTTDKSINELSATFVSLRSGIKSTGDALFELGNGITAINLPVLNLSLYGSRIKNAGSDLVQTAGSTDHIIKTLGEHKKNVNEFKSDVANVRNDVKKLRESFLDTKKSIIGIIDSLKITVILSGIIFFLMFGMLILNALGGLAA